MIELKPLNPLTNLEEVCALNTKIYSSQKMRIGVYYKSAWFKSNMYNFLYKYFDSKNQIRNAFKDIIYLTDGKEIIFLKANEESKGCRFTFAFVEDVIDDIVFNAVISQCVMGHSYFTNAELIPMISDGRVVITNDSN